MPERKVRVTYTKSAIGYNQRQKDTIKALGLSHLGQSIEKTINPAVQGMLNKVPHLVTVEEMES